MSTWWCIRQDAAVTEVLAFLEDMERHGRALTADRAQHSRFKQECAEDGGLEAALLAEARALRCALIEILDEPA